MRIRGLAYHIPRLRFELGQRLILDKRRYRVRGYLPNRLTTSAKHEPHLLAPFRRALATKPGLFVDVGVNTGQTLLKLLTIDPLRAYLGFEPQVGCCFFIDQFLRDNGIENARVICLALSDCDRLLPIYAQGQYDEMASLIEGDTTRDGGATDARYIPARIGDEVLAEMAAGPVAILKVDVEGAEISVFQGLGKTIARDRPICFFEVLPNYVGDDRVMIREETARRNRARADALLSFFHDAGYQIRQIDAAGGERAIPAFSLDTPATHVGNDYVAYPAS